jgi:hypothetical protein
VLFNQDAARKGRFHHAHLRKWKGGDILCNNVPRDARVCNPDAPQLERDKSRVFIQVVSNVWDIVTGLTSGDWNSASHSELRSQETHAIRLPRQIEVLVLEFTKDIQELDQEACDLSSELVIVAE